MTDEQPSIARGPFSIDGRRGNTRQVDRQVLVIAHHHAGAARLLDIAPLVESDQRVQVIYTVPPASRFRDGVAERLSRDGAFVLPWWQATQHPFDLALAAGQGLLEQVHAPIMLFPHGAGHSGYMNRWEGHAAPPGRVASDLAPSGLMRHGRVIPSAIMLAHEDHRRHLARDCPEALPSAVTAGDPCFDRLLASRPRRAAYRDALGVGPGQRLVLVASWWSECSLVGGARDAIARLAAALPPGDRMVAILHPIIWTWHGRRQVLAWHEEAMRAGVRLLPHESGWQAALIAADALIGDRCSVTSYGAALGLPTLLGPYDPGRVVPGTPFDLLGEVAPRLRLDAPLGPQLDKAAAVWTPERAAQARTRLTSAPGHSATIIRKTMYKTLGLPEPPTTPALPTVPLPHPIAWEAR